MTQSGYPKKDIMAADTPARTRTNRHPVTIYILS